MALVQGKLGELSRGCVSGLKKKTKKTASRLGSPLHLPKRTLQPCFTIRLGTWMLLGCSLVKPLSSSYYHRVPFNASSRGGEHWESTKTIRGPFISFWSERSWAEVGGEEEPGGDARHEGSTMIICQSLSAKT